MKVHLQLYNSYEEAEKDYFVASDYDKVSYHDPSLQYIIANLDPKRSVEYFEKRLRAATLLPSDLDWYVQDNGVAVSIVRQLAGMCSNWMNRVRKGIRIVREA